MLTHHSPWAPELTDDQVQDWLDRGLPEVGSPRERGKPTTAAVFDANGHRRLETSGTDGRSDNAREWMDDYGWLPTANQVETHAEAKVVVDMIQGRLPRHVTLVINNALCKEVNPRVASCEAFIRESLPPGYSLRIYENSGRDPWYFEGKR